MIIVAGYTLIDASERDAAIAAFRPHVERARMQGGCIDFAVSADPIDERRINLFELWSNQEALEASWNTANPPKLETIETKVAVYSAAALED
jgi:quinol monooxygenase YgiN